MRNHLLILMAVISFGIYGFYLLHRPSYDQLCIQAIVGEAANQSEDTMVCIAHAIRNRGTLKGVYGLNAKHIWSEPESVWKNATVAWDLSAHEADVVNGAKNFMSEDDEADYYFNFDQEHLGIWCGDFYFY